MSVYKTCIHDKNHPKNSIVIDPTTFQRFCAVCKKPIESFNQDKIADFDRAMKGIG